jgi:hypothetical protein
MKQIQGKHKIYLQWWHCPTLAEGCQLKPRLQQEQPPPSSRPAKTNAAPLELNNPCNCQTTDENTHIETSTTTGNGKILAELEHLSRRDLKREKRNPKRTKNRLKEPRAPVEIREDGWLEWKPRAAPNHQNRRGRRSWRPASLCVRTKWLSGTRSKCANATWRRQPRAKEQQTTVAVKKRNRETPSVTAPRRQRGSATAATAWGREGKKRYTEISPSRDRRRDPLRNAPEVPRDPSFPAGESER